MTIMVPLHGILVSREGHKIITPSGQPFEFSDDELAHLTEEDVRLPNDEQALADAAEAAAVAAQVPEPGKRTAKQIIAAAAGRKGGRKANRPAAEEL